MKKRVWKLMVSASLLVFLIMYADVGTTDTKEVVSDIKSIDAQSTTGPLPPLKYYKGVGESFLNGEVVIEGVPAYIWHHGCGPTAAGMVIGYWDGQGFDELIEGSATYQTQAVNDMIASNENYQDYCLPIDHPPNLLPDKSEPPFGDEHDDNCVADFMKTSQSYYKNYYGWSWYSDVPDGISGYISWKSSKYRASTVNLRWSSGLWERYCEEIDEGRPVVLLVDTDGDGRTDHFVTAIGYDENHHYACYNTWDTDIHWYNFSKISTGELWGIYGATFCSFLNYPPTIPHSPSPSNNSKMVNTNVELEWNCEDPDGNTLFYDVYLAKGRHPNENDIVSSNQVDNNYLLESLDTDSQYFWRIVARDTEGFTREGPIWNFWTTDTKSPETLIIKPLEGYLYIANESIKDIGITMIIGDINVEVNAEDENSGIEKVEFYVDNALKFVDTESPYIWVWMETIFGKHEIKVIAYDYGGNTASDEREVWIFNI